MFPIDSPGTPATRATVVPDQGTFVLARAPRPPGILGALLRRASTEDARATDMATRVARVGAGHAPVPLLRDVMESGVTARWYIQV